MLRRSFLLSWMLAMAACKSDEVASVRVLAAASLTEVLPVVASRWSASPDGLPVEFVFDATSRLAAQIEAGAPADVFFSADPDWMATLANQGLVVGDTRCDLLGNRLVVVVPQGAASALTDLEGLRGVERLALAGAAVPAGRYARAALQSLDMLDALTPKIIHGDNVRTALAWVAKGEADAAIVYATDAMVEPDVRVAFTLPQASHPPIIYPVAALTHAAQPDAARRLVAFFQTDAARDLFGEAGFAPLP